MIDIGPCCPNCGKQSLYLIKDKGFRLTYTCNVCGYTGEYDLQDPILSIKHTEKYLERIFDDYQNSDR